MTTTTADTLRSSVQSGVPAIVRSFLTGVGTARAARRERARLLAELSQCSDRELADMNLSRADIGHVVRSWQPT